MFMKQCIRAITLLFKRKLRPSDKVKLKTLLHAIVHSDFRPPNIQSNTYIIQKAGFTLLKIVRQNLIHNFFLLQNI